MRFRTKDGIYVESTLITHLMNGLVLRAFPEQEVNWSSYAKQYDAVTMDLKPEYQEIINMPLNGKHAELKFPDYQLCCDLGAGTGNLSIRLAKKHPQMKVAHVDFNKDFMSIARDKAEKDGITNVDFHTADAEQVKEIQEQYGKPFDVIFMIHAFYAMRSKEDPGKPIRVLNAIHKSLRKGGYLWITDVEREMNLAYLIYLGLKTVVKKYGFREALDFFKRMDQAKHQNANALRKHRDGTYITQTIAGLIGMLSKAGFKEKNIVYKSGFNYYHGCDNIVVIRKDPLPA